MASADRPRGFTPVGGVDGSPWNAAIRYANVTDAADIFMHDVLEIASGLVLAMDAVGDPTVGVAVGFGKNGTVNGVHAGLHNTGFMFDPDNLETGSRYYDDSASTHTEWTCYFVERQGQLFEGQQDDGTDLNLGGTYDIVLGSGSTTTGLSGHEIDGNASTDATFEIVRAVTRPDVSATDANADWVVKIIQ